MNHHPSIRKSIEVAARFGFISRSLFWNIISSNKQTQTYQYWNELTKSGLFEPLTSAFDETYLKLTRTSREIAMSQKIALMPLPVLNQIAHDEFLIAFALRLESANLIQKATPECHFKAFPNTLKNLSSANLKKIPDLYFKLNVANRDIRIALEYEKTRKTSIRYRSMLLSYAGFSAADMVLFIVNDNAIEKSIRIISQKVQYPVHLRPLAFALASDVEKEPLKFPMRLQKREISFQNFVQELSAAKDVAA